LWIGANKVGISDLDAALAEVRALGLTDPEHITAEILQRVRKTNYIPSEAEAGYARALLGAYRRSLGEDVPERPGVLEVRVYGGD
jgi:hypothetical protein